MNSETAGGLFKQLAEKNTFTFQGGEHSILEIESVMSDFLGITLTKENKERLETLRIQALEAQKAKELAFLNKWGEKVVDLHKWLDNEFGKPFTRWSEEAYKSWKISGWEGESEYSDESILLDWEKGIYTLRFNIDAGHLGENSIIKKDLSEEYIRNCINNWK